MAEQKKKERASFGWVAGGFILALAGFAVIFYAIWTTATIPINNLTLTGIALAGVGVAVGAIGLDRGITVTEG